MELYACGFNAWNQLRFDADLLKEPYDLWQFEKILHGKLISVQRAGFTNTLVKTSSGLVLAGIPDDFTRRIETDSEYFKLAEAGSGKIAASCDQNGNDSTIREYNSWIDYPDHPTNEWGLGKIKQIVAGRTTFTALSVAGDVWTWGDERYQACLGRDITTTHSHSNAAQPGLVSDLQSLPTGPITKIASGGSIMAALTAEHDLYLWGVDELLHLDGQPAPLDLGEIDVLDVGVGDSHVIVLTADRRVLIMGKGQNGQLGMGDGVEKQADWREVHLELEAGWRPVQVVAGPRCSFVIVSNET